MDTGEFKEQLHLTRTLALVISSDKEWLPVTDQLLYSSSDTACYDFFFFFSEKGGRMVAGKEEKRIWIRRGGSFTIPELPIPDILARLQMYLMLSLPRVLWNVEY